MAGGNYVRVYTTVLTDDKFHDLPLAGLGAWLKLLLYADEMYPAPAPLPRWLGDDVLADLVDRRLVDRWGDDHYLVHGLKKERERRSQLARQNANARWSKRDEHSNGSAPAMQSHSNGNASQAKPSQAEPSQAKQDAGARAYYAIKGGQVSEKALAFVDDLVRDYGDDETARAIGAEARATSVDREFLSRVKGRLILEARQRDHEAEARRKAAEAEYQRQLREGVESMTPEQRAENMARLKEAIDGVKEMP